MKGIDLAEAGWIPDGAIRLGIRRMLRERLREVTAEGCEGRTQRKAALIEQLAAGPIAVSPEAANEQHYEVEPGFFEQVLGPHLKYSCGWWGPGVRDLAGAEEAMLRLTARRAGLRDGMRVLDLGCGWGSFGLWAAERLPGSRVLAVSNSKLQREWIAGRAARRGLRNLEVRTADVNDFDPEERFDRVVSVEMFEHVRNHDLLLARIAGWLRPGGRLFVHHFCHREAAYPYEDRGDGDWMARHFFSGGLMPSEDWLLHFPAHLGVERRWTVSGRHYRETCEAWLRNLDTRRGTVAPALERTYGSEGVELWRRRWRLFFLACAELFGFRGGEEWRVAHLRLAPRSEIPR